MVPNRILVIGLIVASVFLLGVIGVMTSAGHNTADGLFRQDHHNGDDCGEHHHFYEFWNMDHHHHENDDHEDCHDEIENENGTV